jgi:hypothetical protein
LEDKLQKAFETANYMVTLSSQRHLLKEEFKQSLICYQNSAVFTASMPLISFVKDLVELQRDSAVLIDDNEQPVLINNLSEFLEKLISVYFSSANAYYSKFDSLRKSRTVEKISQL